LELVQELEPKLFFLFYKKGFGLGMKFLVSFMCGTRIGTMILGKKKFEKKESGG
jgi:hypothetical protein